MQYLIGFAIGVIICLIVRMIVTTIDGELHAHHTEDGTYLSLEIRSMNVINKPFIFLKVKHFDNTH